MYYCYPSIAVYIGDGAWPRCAEVLSQCVRGGKATKKGRTMKIKYCKKYEKYVSQQHCEFFNEGDSCEFYSPLRWSSIKDLMKDDDRPKWDANAIIKPFQCNLMNREILNQRNRARRLGRRLVSL